MVFRVKRFTQKSVTSREIAKERPQSVITLYASDIGMSLANLFT